MKRKDITGQKFGALTAVRFIQYRKSSSLWEFQCDCGNLKNISIQSVFSGRSSSCGCRQGGRLSHGQSGGRKTRTPTYTAWASMIQRCTNPNSKNFCHYGGRGVGVCESWRTFQGFVADMGDRPDGLELERIDNDLGYFPGNCRWVTRAVQMRNTRRTILVAIGNKTQCVKDWCVELGISQDAVRHRVEKRGMPLIEALTRPYIKGAHNH